MRELILVESPNKISSIKQLLKGTSHANAVIMATVGNFMKINDSGEYNMGIDVKNNFKADYVIDPNKKDIVAKLKEQVKIADIIYLAQDPDRAGEQIAYHAKTQLKIPNDKYKRVTYHEITKSAILKALDDTRMLDEDLISAALVREKLDKIVGYRLSGIARNNVGARSVGRCQSAGLKLIVQREEEIQNFKPETFYEILLHFIKNKAEFTAKYLGTDGKEVAKLPSLDECKKISNECKKNPYIISNVEFKDSLENPKPPFITSSYQQEVSKKLGISVKWAMDAAQKLFESGFITYHRTDSPTLANEFLDAAKDYVIDNFGKEYYSEFKVGKKSENAQEGHEAIRCVDINLTPKALARKIDDEKLIRIYDIIWRRSIACCMKPAIIANTIYTIKNQKHVFGMTAKELKFEGYRKIYTFGKDDDESDDEGLIKETFKKDEILQSTSLEANERTTKPPSRYNESSFIKELERSCIGRPSTFATILGVILDDKRGYTKIEDKYIVPTDLGIKLSHFLDDKFSNVISVGYTAELEKELDLIANGKKDGVDFLTDFYKNLEESINKVEPQQQEVRICPECGKPLKLRKSKYGKYFYGCSGWPNCNHIENIK